MEELNQDNEIYLAEVYDKYGLLHGLEGAHLKAWEYLAKSIHIYERLGVRDESLLNSLYNQGTVLVSLQQYSQAIESFLKCKDIILSTYNIHNT
jgi:tetratricopeptide (TPR) repeat protein